MDKHQLIQRLMATFLEELDEHVRAFNEDLLALEKRPNAEEAAVRLKTLFRTAHSLKGAARSVNVEVIESACHHLEEILSAVRDGPLTFSADVFALLFATADAVEEAGMRLREQQDLAGAPLTMLLPRLQAATDAASPAPAAPVPVREEVLAKLRVPVAVTPPLPAQADVPTTAAQAAVPTALATAAAEARLDPSAGTGTVRVPAEKLDSLLARIGELLVARRRVEFRVEDLVTLRESVTHWKREWRNVEDVSGKFFRDEKHATGGPVPAAHGLHLPRRAARVLRQTGDNLRRLEKDLERITANMAADGRFLEQVSGPLSEEVSRVRMLPFAEACQGLERTARDLAQAGGKDVHLVIEGGAVEMDRSILEGLKDPLRHLVRNAVDHGAESPARRAAAGKPPQTRITIAAALRGAQVEVTVKDDGQGLNLDALRDQARKRKIAEPADERELARLVFLPGLSTARIITDVSGRGVGLDVVKSRVESLHGTVDLSSLPGQGTCFTLTVPLTLTTLRAVLVGVAGQTFAFSGTNVQRFVRVASDELRSVAGRQMLSLGGTPLPVASLAAVLGLNAVAPAGKLPIVIIAAGEKRMAFAVDEFLAEQEIVIKNLGTRIRRMHYVAGATLLPSGRIALVLNAATLIRSALSKAATPLAADSGDAAAPARKRLLVVDDSVTTRTLEKSILEAAGYDVTTAADGRDAWQVLQDHDVDLVVSDVDMPQMDGFALAAAVRGAPRFRDLPFVLVTARETEEDKARGIEVGADAYLVKSAFDQRNLLETIAQLL